MECADRSALGSSNQFDDEKKAAIPTDRNALSN
jgi:hypothetical protein